jgi:hypothetical protein
MTTKPALQNVLDGILNIEEEDKCNHENMENNRFH